MHKRDMNTAQQIYQRKTTGKRISFVCSTAAYIYTSVCICMYMHMYMYNKYSHTHVHMHTYTYTHAHIHSHPIHLFCRSTPVAAHIYMYVYIYMYIYTCMYVNIYTRDSVWHMWINHIKCKWDQSQTHICISHVTHTEGVFRNGAYNWVMSRVPMTAIIYALPNFRFDESCHTYRWVMSTYEWVVSHTSKGSFKLVRMGESCHLRISHKCGINKSCLIYKWAMSHVWMSHVSHVNEWCHLWVIHECVISKSCHRYEIATKSRLPTLPGLF